MRDQELDIDGESKAMQYRILSTGDSWVLEPEYPEFPRTPDENAAISMARASLPLDASGRFVVTDGTRQRLEADPGDVVSLATVINAHVSEICNAMQDVFESVALSISEAAESLVDAFTTISGEAPDYDDDDRGDRDARLPESILEARSRRENQREQNENAIGNSRYGGIDE